MEATYTIGFSQMFTLLFVMLGPFVSLKPYAFATRGMTLSQIKTLALKSTLIALVVLALGGWVGSSLLEKWQIDPHILMLAGGLIFLVMAFSMILRSRPKENVVVPSLVKEEPNALKIALSMMITPYGMSVMILLLSMSQSRERTLLVLAALASVLILDLLSMMFIRQMTGKVGTIAVQILGAVLSVMQVALALQIIYWSVQGLQIV